MAFLNSLTASSSHPRSASSMPRALCSSDCDRVSFSFATFGCGINRLDAGVATAVVTLLFSGDVTLGFHYEEYVEEQIAKGAPADPMLGWGFDKVKGLTTRADLFVVNLECPFTSRGEKL